MSNYATDEFVRLLICRACHTVDEVPDYEGPAEGDELLLRVVGRHQTCTPTGALVGGRSPEEALAVGDRALARVERKHWKDPEKRQQILAQLGMASTGFEQKFYDVRNTLQTDAMVCFTRHNRPQDGCIDYKDQSKLVGNALMSDEDKEANALLDGLRLKRKNKQVFLCDYCPVKSTVQEKAFKKRGLYK